MLVNPFGMLVLFDFLDILDAVLTRSMAIKFNDHWW